MTSRLTILATAGALCALASLAGAPAAQAQQVGEQFKRDHNVSVKQRRRPDYEAFGLRSGGLVVVPSVTAEVGYDSNVFATSTATKSDTIADIIGEVHAMTDWNVHAFEATAQVGTSSYQSLSSENTTWYDLSALGRLDITRDAAIQVSGRDAYLAEDRTAPGSPPSDKPIRYRVDVGTVGGAKAFNRLRFTGEYTYRNIDFKNATIGGVPLSQAYRDHTQDDVMLRGDYAVSPDTALLIEGHYVSRDFKSPGLVNRDSHGYDVTVGADFDVGALARGLVRLGYLHHDLYSPVQPDISGFSGHAQVDFFPTQLLTLTVQADRDVIDGGVATSPSVLSTSGDIEANYELLRNLLLNASVGVAKQEFAAIDRDDQRTTVSLGATYLMNRHVGLKLNYSYLNLSSSGTAARSDFNDNRITASLIAQY